MRKYKDSFYSKKEVHVITCNYCGETIKQNQFGYFEDYITIEKTWGYGSEFDGETHVVDICKTCYKKIFDQLKLSPVNKEALSRLF